MHQMQRITDTYQVKNLLFLYISVWNFIQWHEVMLLVDHLTNIGISVSYSRVTQVESNIALAMCKQF